MDGWLESLPEFRFPLNTEKISQYGKFKPFYINNSFFIKRGLISNIVHDHVLLLNNGYKSYRIESEEDICYISESDDEWFWVIIFGLKSDTYYKCDQFEGLALLLKDKILKIHN